MIEKPDLKDETILAALQNRYGITPTGLEFLPLGNDSSAWVYRARAVDGTEYFLKVKRGEVPLPSVTIPRYLRDHGIPQVVAPLPTPDQALMAPVGKDAAGEDAAGEDAAGEDARGEYALILYPFIPGRTGMETGLTDAQWMEFGAVLKKIHATHLPPELLQALPVETFLPKWSPVVRALQTKIAAGDYDGPFEQELATFWSKRGEAIEKIVRRAGALGEAMRREPGDFILCHTDIHTANLLIDPAGRLHIVDWDQPLFAPKERDLMFIAGDAGEGAALESREARLFFHASDAYGEVTINPTALAYYQYEWVVQEIGDYGERVFLMPDLGMETKADAVRGFIQLFQPGDVVETALKTDQKYLW